MSEHAGSAIGVADRESSAATAIEIDVDGRWDALALSELLVPYSFLVHHRGRRWVVHARTPGCHGEGLSDVLRAIDDWVRERRLERTSCRIDGRPHPLGESVQA